MIFGKHSYIVKLIEHLCNIHDQGPVVQSIFSLTTSLKRNPVKYLPIKLSNTPFFFVEKCENLLQ